MGCDLALALEASERSGLASFLIEVKLNLLSGFASGFET
jgi:hypothetical protein